MNKHSSLVDLARRGEGAQSAPLILLMFVILCGFVGLTVDVGHGLLQKRRLQAAVDLSLLSGARVLPDATNAATVSRSYVKDNFNRVTDLPVDVTTSTGCMLPGCGAHDRLNLVATTTTPTHFARLFGVDEWTVRARGSACGPCDSSPVSYDVIIVLDRSNSMCTDASNNFNNCQDLKNAKEGIRELLNFFDPATDRVGLAVLGSSDTNACDGSTTAHATANNCPDPNSRPFSHTLPRNASGQYIAQTDKAYSPPECDGASPTIPSGQGRFYRSIGDFMDGTVNNHDKWVVVPLAAGTNYKLANGALNEDSFFLNTLDCIQGKAWTPIAPAIYESTEEMRARGRTYDSDGNDVYRAIVYFGDGGGTSTPVKRTANGTPTTEQSWYPWTSGNRDRPCQDAIDQSKRAWNNYGVHVYSIGYALNEGSAQACQRNDGNTESPSINARQTLERMSHGDGQFYEAAAGDVTSIFRAIGHAITAGGTRLVD